MKRGAARLLPALALAAWTQAAPAEWQCHSGAPGGPRAQALLGRAEQIYPSQLLGVLRVSGRVLLVNSTDDGWGERVRQGLMELRLAEPDITAARRFQASAAGASAADVPPGEFVCLERTRAARHGLTLNAGGNVMLAAGRSVHLVDPYETTIVVEVRATGSDPLDFREILALSGRSGIYAGLAGRRAQPAAPAAARQPGDAIVVALGPGGQLGEVVVTPRARDDGENVGEKPATAAVAVVPPAQAPVVAPAPAPRVAEAPPVHIAKAEPPVAPAPAPRVDEAPPARVVKADLPAASPPATPLLPEAPAAVVIAVAEPVAVAAPARAPAAQAAARHGAEQSYEEYANTMKTLLALRRSGGVRSISEMTYVHPAVEDLRAQRR